VFSELCCLLNDLYAMKNDAFHTWICAISLIVAIETIAHKVHCGNELIIIGNNFSNAAKKTASA
jgi:hypothetical protein